MTKPPLTAEEKESYARQLKATLKTRRPRKVLRLLLALIATVAAVALIWRFNRPPIESPPLLLACFDSVGGVGKPVRTQAWLKVVETPPEKSAGLTVHWQVLGRPGELPTTNSDAQGFAGTELPALAAESVLTLQAATKEPEQRYDRGRLFVFGPHTKIVIVPIAPVTGNQALDAERDATLDEMRDLTSQAAAGSRIVYVATADDPSKYRAIRDWIRRQVPRGLPDGPVLRSPIAHLQGATPLLGDIAELETLWSPSLPK